MVKTKNKKKVSSEIVHTKKINSKKKILNPFEIHINKEKIRILGKKQKNDKGLPGVSRAKAIEKRKRTLLNEYKLQNKSNKFHDKRIGEKNHNLTEDDKAIARFTAVRVRAHNKKKIFNLADDEVLTHRGQTLSEIEKFDDPRSDDDSLEDGEPGKLGSDFVGEVHFGGGLLKNTNKEGAQSHKELIEQLITESKKRKAEKQKIKEQTLELTEQLDTEWKDLIPLVSQKKANEVDIQKNDIDDYDKLMRELKFAARGTVSDRLKTEDEIAKEEKEKLEKLEQERVFRMKGITEEDKPHSTHRSADDIEDIVYEDVDDSVLTYNEEGKSNVQIESSYIIRNDKVDYDKGNSNNEEGSETEESEDETDNSEDDSLSDLKSDLSDEDAINNEENTAKKQSQVSHKVIKPSDIDSIAIETIADNEIKEDLLKRKLIMEQAMKELPFTFSLPESYESLQKLFENQSSTHQSIIIERMLKCNHHSLAEGNKDKLGLLFAYLLQYLNDIFDDCVDQSTLRDSFDIFQALVPRMYELAQVNPETSHNSLLEVIKEKHEDYKKQSKKYPGLEVLVFFKLVSILLPTSDFRHQVVTPCFVFMEQLLTKCKVETKRDISYGLFVTTLILEYTSISKRFMPAVINFLSGILHMAIPKRSIKLIKVQPPFKPTSSHLVLLNDLSCNDFNNLKMNCSNLLNSEIEENYKMEVLYACIKILEQFHTSYQDLPSCVEIFSPVLRYLEAIPMDKYPKLIKNAQETFLNNLRNSRDQQKLPYIVMQAMKPKALKMLEPKIEEVFDRKMHRNKSRDKAERDKLLHKLKREKKGALREIRRDKDFLGRVKIQQQIRSDMERREKVKRIYAEAASQQSELNALDRKKKRKK